MTRRHLMLLPGFPLELWTQNVLEGLANSVGKFIRIDNKNMFGMEKKIARVMLEFNITRGLPAEVEIIWGNRIIHQRLDYFQIPFRCFFCCKTGHAKSTCPSLLSGTRSKGSSDGSGSDEGQFSGYDAAPSGFPDDKLPDGIEEDVDKKAAWLLKAFLFGTALYAGCYFLPLMGDSMIQQSVALLRVKDPLFKRMGASRLSRIAINDDRRRTIVEMGGVDGLVNMLNTAPDDLTRREAMKALESLSQSDVAVKALHHAGAQSVINSIVDSTADDDILKYKSKLLRRLHELNFLKE